MCVSVRVYVYVVVGGSGGGWAGQNGISRVFGWVEYTFHFKLAFLLKTSGVPVLGVNSSQPPGPDIMLALWLCVPGRALANSLQ